METPSLDETDLEIKVVFRDFHPDTDNPIIYATWRNNSFYSALIKPTEDQRDIFFKNKTKQIKDILAIATIKIACLQNNPKVIIGYSVFVNTHVYWIYIKEDYRNNGIGTMIAPKEIESVPPQTDLTKIGYEIAKKKKLEIQGEDDGRTEDRQTH